MLKYECKDQTSRCGRRRPIDGKIICAATMQPWFEKEDIVDEQNLAITVEKCQIVECERVQRILDSEDPEALIDEELAKDAAAAQIAKEDEDESDGKQ